MLSLPPVRPSLAPAAAALEPAAPPQGPYPLARRWVDPGTERARPADLGGILMISFPPPPPLANMDRGVVELLRTTIQAPMFREAREWEN